MRKAKSRKNHSKLNSDPVEPIKEIASLCRTVSPGERDPGQSSSQRQAIRATSAPAPLLTPALTCDSLQEPADVENAFLHDALHAHSEDGYHCHYAENKDPHCQENSGGLPEAAGDLPKALGVGPAQCVRRDLLHGRGADAEDAQVVGLRVRDWRLGAAGLGFPNQPVCAQEGNEFSKSHHDTQEGPEHRAAGDNDMTHIDVHGGKARQESTGGGVNPKRQQ